MAEINHLHPRIRRFLLPIYGLDQAISTAALLVIVVLGCLLLEPAATGYVAGGALVGIWVVSWPHAPVAARVSPSLRSSIVQVLDEEWRRSDHRGCWVPGVTGGADGDTSRYAWRISRTPSL